MQIAVFIKSIANNFNKVSIDSPMSEANINSSIVYKIREERQKRSEKCIEHLQSTKTKINFYLNYEELYHSKNEQQIDESKQKIKEKLMPIKKLCSGEKSRKHQSFINHAKKISLNFELFNPKRRPKDEGDDPNKLSYEQHFTFYKEKYMQKIEKIKRKKSQKCKNNSIFGLNIKTVDRNDDKMVLKRESKTKETITKEHSAKDIQEKNTLSEIYQKSTIEKKLPVTQHRTRREPRAQQRSKSFVIDNQNLRDLNFIKVKMFKMINSNNLVLQSFGVYLKKGSEDARYRFYVGNGNNRNLIKSIMKQRWWWSEVNDISLANFVWTQLKHQPTIERQENLEEKEKEKTIQFDNFLTDCTEKKDLNSKNYAFFHPKLSKKLQVFTPERQKKGFLQSFSVPECVHNHFSHNFMFGNKNALFQNLSLYYKYRQENVNRIIPLTFFIEDISSQSFENFLKVSSAMKNAIWIVKPGENSNRGNGIFVCKSGEEIRRKLHRRKNAHTYIIQKYLTNPLLYHKRKFDIRTYLLMLSIGGVTKYFWYNEGYLRTSSEIFDLKDLSDSYIHLTNDAIQKRNDNYGKFQNGNKITYSEFQRYLENNLAEKNYSMKDLNEEMKKIAKIAVNATYHKLDPKRKQYGFELFGLDFIVESNFRPWLIEINTNPCLELSSPTLERIIPRMMENLFRLALDPIYQASEDVPKSKSYYIYDNCLEKNRFELIFDSLFDRDLEWQSLSKQSEEKVYEDNLQIFQGDGEEVSPLF